MISDVLKEVEVADAHNLGDDGQAGSFLGFFEELEALCLKALERIRRGAGLECSRRAGT